MIAKERLDLKEPVIPRLVPQPDWCADAETPVYCLDGQWTVRNLEKPEEKERRVEVPFDTTVLRRKEDFPRHYEYLTEILLPAMAEDSRVVLKFEAVNAFAEIYVDEVYVASHKNGFLTFNVEITEQVRGKDRVSLRMVLDEESDVVSAYSHGGILHSVYLYVLPRAYVNAVYLSPIFSEDMDSCRLRVDMDVAKSSRQEDMSAVLTLTDPDGTEVNRIKAALDVKEDGYYTVNIPVEEPKLWDSEHPDMYTVEIALYSQGQKLESLCRRTGLRKLERKGNRLFVNKQEIKLKGVCRHETSALRGRATTREIIEQDVALFKEANCNYIRTSHYPPTEYFLELCDENGLYVELELALAFIARTLPYTQRDPEHTERYISHFTECLARDYNHPSIVMWSMCNESFGGYNFDLLNRYIHRKDPTRMTKFSYPMTIREEHEMPDIWSIHYSEYDTDLAMKRDNLSVGHAPGKDMPVLHDEYVHVCCYNREELRRDQSVRILWGDGIRIFWDNIWNTEGALGGAIWAGIDETDIYTGGSAQLEWGIIDVWRRKKPEFYMTRKAYSPIKVLHYQLEQATGKVVLVLENRFCHTDFKEVRLDWRCGDASGELCLPRTTPFHTTKVVFGVGEAAKGGAPVAIGFYDANGVRVDEMVVAEETSKPPLLAMEEMPGGSLEICKKEQETLVRGKNFVFSFAHKSGLLNGLWVGEKRLLTGGPMLNAPYFKLGIWYLTDSRIEKVGEQVVVTIKGGYEKTLQLTFRITVDPDGTFTTSYIIDKMEKELPGNLKLRVGMDCGGLDELGVAYLADPSMDTLSWNREVDHDSEWDYTWYPAEHISRNMGTAERFSEGNIWGERPRVCWVKDMKNDILNGRFDVDYKGTNDFRTTKERVEEAYLYSGQEQAAIGVFGGKDIEKANIRLEVLDPAEWKILDTDAGISYHGTWYQVDDVKESDHGSEMWSREKGAYAEYTFIGTGIVWYGPQDTIFGMANVYVDGVLAAEKLSQRTAGVDFSCSSVGYDKKYHIPMFSVDNLPVGEHTIRIEVSGEKAIDASDYYIAIDYLRVLNGERTEPVKLIVNQEYSFPHISWGNYRKPPIIMEEGTTGTVRMKAVCEKEPVRDKIDRVVNSQPVF